jgi:hypothetical protein
VNFVGILAALGLASAQEPAPEPDESEEIEDLEDLEDFEDLDGLEELEDLDPDVPDLADIPVLREKPTQVGKTHLPIDLGVGVFFNAGGSFMDQPDDRTVDGSVVPFNGFAGFSPGFGLSLEFSGWEILGLEIGFIWSKDSAKSKFILDEVDFPFSTYQRAFHLPILFELSAPKGPVRPLLFGGREFVFPGEPTVNEPSGLTMDVKAHNSAYGHWAFGFGFEFVLPIDEIDIRIPWTFKGTVDSTWPNSAGELAEYTIVGSNIGGIDYLTNWQFHAAVGLGLSVHFL